MFCKIKISRYFDTFINDNIVILKFNMGQILAPNQLLC